jgi:hypothetical protein
MPKYRLTAENDGRLPVLRKAWIAWRPTEAGPPEFRGVFASEADARADVAVTVVTAGWRVAGRPDRLERNSAARRE